MRKTSAARARARGKTLGSRSRQGSWRRRRRRRSAAGPDRRCPLRPRPLGARQASGWLQAAAHRARRRTRRRGTCRASHGAWPGRAAGATRPGERSKRKAGTQAKPRQQAVSRAPPHEERDQKQGHATARHYETGEARQYEQHQQLGRVKGKKKKKRDLEIKGAKGDSVIEPHRGGGQRQHRDLTRALPARQRRGRGQRRRERRA
jgi:hypothetical protein